MSDMYSSVAPAAPFVIGAYGLIWVTLIVFVGLTFRRITRLEKELEVVEDSMKRRQA
jgi:CcmD family protein